MGQLFRYLFEHQEEGLSYWTFCIVKRLIKQPNCLLKYLCKGGHGADYFSVA